MLILAVDTTSRAGSLALWRDGRVTRVVEGDPARTHGERLPGDIAALLSQEAVEISDIDLYAVVTGPGSFTGLRVGIAAVQGLALARRRQVIPVPALEAYAWTRDASDGRIAVWRDAQRKQVFAALFDRRGDDLRSVLPPVSQPPADVVQEWIHRGIQPDVFVGDGVDLYRGQIQDGWPDVRRIIPAPALAPIAAVMAARRPEAAVAPHAIVPIYVRAADAELARARRDSGR